jgi:PAS domain S-box-containing protein
MRTTLLATAAVVGVLGLLEAGVLPSEAAQRTTDVLQLALSLCAAVACLQAAPRGGGAARAFWTAIGLGCLSWAGGQAFWVARTGPFSLAASYAQADVLFTASTAAFIVAYVLRPGRGRTLATAIDVVLVAIAILYVFCQVALVHALVGDADAYRAWSTFFFDLRGLALLPAVLWGYRYSSPPWNALHARLAPAFVLLQAGGVLSNQAFTGGPFGPYHAGFRDLPWTLPFAWIALVAWQFRHDATDAAREPTAAPGWQRARRATVTAFVSVLLFPLLHIGVAWNDDPRSPRARVRGVMALVGTLLVTSLYLLRQRLVLGEAEAALREGEQRYRALLDSGGDPVGVYAADLRVLYVSGALKSLGGYEPHERIGQNVLDLVHPDDADVVRRVVATILRAPGERVRTSFRASRRDGSWRELEVDVVNRLDEPAVAGVVANIRDVTEQRRAERERERSLSLLEATLDATADGILVVDRQGRIERFNQRFAAMWGLPPALVASGDNESAMRFVLDQLQDPERFIERVQARSERPEQQAFDSLRFHDGRVFERHALPQQLAGEVVGRVLSFRDVSARARAEAAMTRLVAIIEATPDFVLTCDAFSRPLYVNRAGRRMVGLADEESLVGRRIDEFHPPGAAARLREEAIPHALREGAWSGENTLVHRDGREIPVLQVVLAHRSAGGEVEFLSSIARDISEREQAEQELRRSHTMAALGSLVAGVAHEVRNPLFGISSTLDAFEARFGAEADQRQYVGALREQLDRLTHLMNDLLEYGKPTRLELRQGRLEHVVAHAVLACAPLEEQTGVTIETRVAPDLPPLRMDERRLGQVFRNLLENALQHSQAADRVRLEARLVHRHGAAWLECVVEDDGPGFDREDLPHLFEPFFTRRRGGTGLGLSIVHRIVADHGGSISAANRSEGGATLTLALPATLKEA